MIPASYLGVVMLFRVVAVALLATVCGSALVQAQSVADLGGPSNMPPAGFKGQQFVDNRGCVFLKAGYGGQTTWVPRVSRDRKALCGYPPTFGARPAIEMAEDAAPAAPAPVVKPAAAPVVVAAPAVRAPAPKPVAVATVTAPAPYVDTAPRGTYEAVATGPGPGKIGCYTSAPVAERVKLRSGGTAVVCTRGDGTMTGWRPPVYPQGSGVGASLSDGPVAVASRGASGGSGGYVESYAAASDAVPVPPPGYELAWKDDRLNPNRGKGTAEGWAAQDQIWTRKVPATLVADQAAKRKKAVPVQEASDGSSGDWTHGAPTAKRKKVVITYSTKNAPTAPVPQASARAAGAVYVQVGTFGVQSNADGAASRLRGAGLPTARANITSKGKAMQIVLAGPFASGADAQAALSAARRAGFGDAFIR